VSPPPVSQSDLLSQDIIGNVFCLFGPADLPEAEADEKAKLLEKLANLKRNKALAEGSEFEMSEAQYERMKMDIMTGND
jgi:hypothetical protein